MPSQIKVDEIKNVAGQYEIKTNTFKGQTTAGSITVQGEGTATTNLQQGLCKVWFNHGTDFASDDSLNVSSIADDGSGELTPSFSNAFGNAEYAYSGQGIDGDKNTTFIFVEGATQATGSLPILTGTQGGGTTTKTDTAAAHLIFGDLA